MSKLLKLSNLIVFSLRNARKSRSVRPYLRDLYYRRLAQGPEKYRPRSDWLNWNRDTELSAFLHRIGENIPKTYTEKIFVDKSYITCMLETSKEYNTTILQGNDELARDGFEVSKFFINTYLHSVYPRFPEEWITILNNHLLSSQELAFIGAHLGIKDLILYSDYKDNRIESKLKIISGPPSLDIISTALMALIGALAKEQIERAHLFVKDFILVRLVDYDLNELFHIPNPFELLAGILASEGRGPPESRLQNQCGMNTILACYQVGIYSDRGLIGEAPGETISIAEDEAARQAIRSYFGLTEDRPPLIFGSSQIHDQNNLNVPGNPKVSIESYLNRKSSMETS